MWHLISSIHNTHSCFTRPDDDVLSLISTLLYSLFPNTDFPPPTCNHHEIITKAEATTSKETATPLIAQHRRTMCACKTEQTRRGRRRVPKIASTSPNVDFVLLKLIKLSLREIYIKYSLCVSKHVDCGFIYTFVYI